MAAMVAAMRRGPPGAVVRELDRGAGRAGGAAGGFRIRPDRPQSQAAPRTPELSPCRFVHQAGVEPLAEDVGLDARRHGLVEARDVGEAAAEHDHVRVEHVDDHRQRAAEPVLEAAQRLLGRRVAALGQRHDLLRRAAPSPAARRCGGRSRRRGSGPTARPRCGRRTPQEQSGPGRSSSSGVGSGMCPHSPPMALTPSTSRPCTTRPPPTPVPRMTPKTTCAPAPPPSTASREREAVGVVGDLDRPVERGGEVAAQVAAVQPGRVAHRDAAGRRGRPSPGTPMPTRLDAPAGLGLELLHQARGWRGCRRRSRSAASAPGRGRARPRRPPSTMPSILVPP